MGGLMSIIGSVFTFLVLYQKEYKEVSSVIYFIALSWETIPVGIGLMEQGIRNSFYSETYQKSYIWVSFVEYGRNFLLVFTHWSHIIVLLMGVERFIACFNTHWFRFINRPRIVHRILFVSFLLTCPFDFQKLLYVDRIDFDNFTENYFVVYKSFKPTIDVIYNYYVNSMLLTCGALLLLISICIIIFLKRKMSRKATMTNISKDELKTNFQLYCLLLSQAIPVCVKALGFICIYYVSPLASKDADKVLTTMSYKRSRQYIVCLYVDAILKLIGDVGINAVCTMHFYLCFIFCPKFRKVFIRVFFCGRIRVAPTVVAMNDNE